jgi:hypothetical protein
MFLELQTDGTASNTRILRATKGAQRHACLDVVEESHETQLYLELPYALLELVCERDGLGYVTSVKLAVHAAPAESDGLLDSDPADYDRDAEDQL